MAKRKPKPQPSSSSSGVPESQELEVVPIVLEPTFTTHQDGISITGLGEGIMYVSENAIGNVLRMSVEGYLYPYEVITAMILMEEPTTWMCVLREKK